MGRVCCGRGIRRGRGSRGSCGGTLGWRRPARVSSRCVLAVGRSAGSAVSAWLRAHPLRPVRGSLVGFALLRFSGSSAAPRSGSRVFGQSGCPRRQWQLVSQPGPSLLHTEIGRKLEIRPPEGPAPLFPGCDGVVFAWSATCSGQFCARPCPSRHLS